MTIRLVQNTVALDVVHQDMIAPDVVHQVPNQLDGQPALPRPGANPPPVNPDYPTPTITTIDSLFDTVIRV